MCVCVCPCVPACMCVYGCVFVGVHFMRVLVFRELDLYDFACVCVCFCARLCGCAFLCVACVRVSRMHALFRPDIL